MSSRQDLHVNDAPPAIEKGDAPYRNVVVIINPAAGQDRPILGVMNKAFHDAGIDWDVKITKAGGDAERFAHEAVAAGVDAVGVYGGDGTVMEVANGMLGSKVPLAIFPGGTANVMSLELGIPSDLAEAMALVCTGNSFVRKVDVGRCDDRYFMLRIGIGFEADMIRNADREAKSRMGRLAYLLSALQTEKKMACFRMTLDDDDEIEVEGMSCMIANSGNVGVPGLTMARMVDVSDGLLDVLVIHSANIGALVEVAASAAGLSDSLSHYQVRKVTVHADPPQAAICDGEPIGGTPITATIVPNALHVIVPRAAISGQDAAAAERADQPQER
jgi:diacylglycerol kinase (ATP)